MNPDPNLMMFLRRREWAQQQARRKPRLRRQGSACWTLIEAESPRLSQPGSEGGYFELTKVVFHFIPLLHPQHLG